MVHIYDSPTEHLAVDISFVPFNFKHYIPKKHKRFEINTYKLYNSKVYRNNMNVYLGKDRQYASPCMTATRATATGLNVKLDNVGQKLSTYNLFSSPALTIYILWQWGVVEMLDQTEKGAKEFWTENKTEVGWHKD